jgi:hypothetical protein
MKNKQSIGEFLSIYFVTGILSGILGLFLLISLGQNHKLVVLFWGWGTSWIIILLGYLANQWAFARSHKVFFGVLLGGMALRILVVMGILALVWRYGWFPVFWFLLILAGYYFLFQTVEVWVIHRQLKRKGTDS